MARSANRKLRTSAARSARELIGAAMKKMKRAPRAPKKFSPDGANRAQRKNGATDKAAAPPILQPSKAEIEAAIQRYVDLFDFAPIGYVTFDQIGCIEDINLAAIQLVGRTRRHLLGHAFALYVAKADAQLFLHHLLRCRSARGRIETKLHLQRRDGTAIPVQLSSTPILSSMRKGTLLYQTAIVDLTARKAGEAALRQSEERYRAIVNQSIAGMARADLKGRLMFVNQRFCQMLGYKEAELVGETIRAVTHPDDREQNMKLFRRMIRKKEPYEWEKRFLRKNGSILWASVSAAPVPDDAGKVQSAVAVIIDISDRRKVQAELEDARNFLELRVREQTEELQAANKELKREIKRRQGLEGQILEVSDREQQRLGTELHDGLCQHLTAIAFMARATALRLKNHRVISADDIEKIAELVNDAANDARNLARALHHVDVDSSSFVPALEDLVDREIWKTPCRLEIAPSFHIENDEAAAHLYRIAREAVINASKHAQARHIVVKVHRSPKEIVLSIVDDGVGISASVDRSQGMGFHIMNQRAKSIGGSLDIKCAVGGTRVTCYLPN